MKNIKFKKIIIPIFLSFTFIFQANNLVFGTSLEQKDDKKTLLKKLENEEYLIGTGDILKIDFLNINEISGKYEVMNGGKINLPIINMVNLNNLTISEAQELIEKLYQDQIINPKVFISIDYRKPIRVSISGEVERPGLYVFDEKNNISNIKKFPTFVDLIHKSGGFTKNANLFNVELYRRISDQKNNFNTKKTNINVRELLIEGNQIHNPFLMNGDIIKVKYLNNDTEFNLDIVKSNLSQPFIKVNIVGEVVQPGEFEISPNTPLVQAIYLAGGPTRFKAKKNIKLIRITDNGRIISKIYKTDLSQSISSKNNPLLENGDIVIIGKTNLSKGLDNVKELTSPITGIVNTLTLIKLLNN